MFKEILIEKTPKYTDILPFLQRRVTYRPFIVREEKNLLIAKETTSFENLMTTIQDVINSCCENLPDNDCKNLPFCDLEFIFLKIREKSLGELVECEIVCPITNETIKTQIDLSKIRITNKKIETKIKLDNSISIVMRVPTLSTYLSLSKFDIKEEEDEVFKLLAMCIKEVQSDEEKFYTNDVPFEEVLQFVEQLTTKQFKQLLNFLKEVPTVEYQINYTTSDGTNRNIMLRGFSDFLELFLVMQI